MQALSPRDVARPMGTPQQVVQYIGGKVFHQNVLDVAATQFHTTLPQILSDHSLPRPLSIALQRFSLVRLC